MRQNPRMSNIATALREEITRLARKEIRNETVRLQKAVTTYRSEIAALKRRVTDLERQAKRRPDKQVALPAVDAEDNDSLRFRAEGFASNRQRLGITAAEMAHLLGVSPLSIYKWEHGKAKPRRAHLPAIAALRGVGKRDVAARLQELATKA